MACYSRRTYQFRTTKQRKSVNQIYSCRISDSHFLHYASPTKSSFCLTRYMATKKVVRLHDATGPKPKRIMKKLKIYCLKSSLIEPIEPSTPEASYGT